MSADARKSDVCSSPLVLSGSDSQEAAAIQAITRFSERRVTGTAVDPNEIVSMVVERLTREQHTLTAWRTYHVNDAFLQLLRKGNRRQRHLKEFAARRARERAATSAAELGDPAAMLEDHAEAAREVRTVVRFVRRRDRRFLRWWRYRHKIGLPPGVAIRLAGFGRSVFFVRKRALIREYLKFRGRRPPE